MAHGTRAAGPAIQPREIDLASSRRFRMTHGL
jgi:hypothetical protein